MDIRDLADNRGNPVTTGVWRECSKSTFHKFEEVRPVMVAWGKSEDEGDVVHYFKRVGNGKLFRIQLLPQIPRAQLGIDEAIVKQPRVPNEVPFIVPMNPR